ncbi:MAG: alpha/beta fold hydrolase, partial [Pseudomonadota bacterium]
MLMMLNKTPWLAACLALLLAGCGESAPEPDAAMEETAPAPESTAAPAAAPEPASVEETLLPGIRFHEIESNGITMRVAEMGEGPAVLLAHGWPESWYSWRHQIKALADAGYRALAPDMRGYGGTDAPEDVASYNL